MSTHLDILADAIQDVGYWRWWTSQYPDIFQVEFGGVQIYTPPQQPNQPPPGLIALRFTNPISVNFLTFPEAPDDFPPNWLDLLHNDTLDPQTISYDTFIFNDPQHAQSLLQDAKQVTTAFGQPPTPSDLASAPITLAFRAGYTGLLVTAQALTILSIVGEIQPEEIEQKHNEWWLYWQEYWRLKDTDNPLPEDYACEVTIPAGE
jgi:hypothetical protein